MANSLHLSGIVTDHLKLSGTPSLNWYLHEELHEVLLNSEYLHGNAS